MTKNGGGGVQKPESRDAACRHTTAPVSRTASFCRLKLVTYELFWSNVVSVLQFYAVHSAHFDVTALSHTPSKHSDLHLFNVRPKPSFYAKFHTAPNAGRKWDCGLKAAISEVIVAVFPKRWEMAQLVFKSGQV